MLLQSSQNQVNPDNGTTLAGANGIHPLHGHASILPVTVKDGHMVSVNC